MKTKLRFLIMPCLALAFIFAAGPAWSKDVKTSGKATTEQTITVEPIAPVKLEQKEAYKLDNAEYKAAVATPFSYSAGDAIIGSAILGIFITLLSLFHQFKHYFTLRNAVISAIALALVGTFFIDANPALMSAELLTIPFANQLKGLKEEKGKKVKEMNSLVQMSEKENRDFTADEIKKYDGFKDEVEKLNTRLARVEESHKRELEEAAASGHRISPIGERSEVSEREEKDLQRYSLLKVVRSFCPQQFPQDKELRGIELEMHHEAVKEARINGAEIKGVGVPLIIMKRWGKRPERRDMTVGTTTAGGFFVQTDVDSEVIEPLRNKLVTAAAGARVIGGLVGNVDIPTNGGVSVGSAATENASAAESTPTIGRRQLTPKRLTGFSDLSVQLIKQTSWDVENMIREDYLKAMAVALDLAALNGSGASGQPTGILGTSGIGSVAGGTNGLAPTLAHITSLEEEVAIDNADLGSLSYITNPKVRRKLKNTVVDAGSGLMVWDRIDRNFPLNGYAAHITNNMPSTLDKGTSTGVCSAILFGNFNDLLIGMWGGMDVMANPYTKAKEGQVEIIAAVYADVAVRRAVSFAAMLDALTT